MRKIKIKMTILFCKSWSIFLFLFFIISFVDAQTNEQKGYYQFFINLNKLENNKLRIQLITPKINQQTLTYHFPAIVPGTYEITNLGRFISDFKAYDLKGNTLEVIKMDINSWSIKNAYALYKLSYLVCDTWDTSEVKGGKIFELEGTYIEDKKVFMLNTFGIAGFFDGFQNLNYKLMFTKPEEFYGATSLMTSKVSSVTEEYTASNYQNLVDAPIMFCNPDTVTLKIGGANILFAVYSPNKIITAKKLAKELTPMLYSINKYMGGKLPILKYAFILLSDDKKIESAGALEHGSSSLYVQREDYPIELIKNTASHEFFHILTPLHIHSKEIGEFNFIKPEMSKHLWLYEGMTEYESKYMQVKYDLNDLTEFLTDISDKITISQSFNDTLPFTVMSKGVLDIYKDQYMNVYNKGALISLCLDIKLRQLSDGKYGIQELMNNLYKKYGETNYFKDDDLFDEISKLTYPSIRAFFTDYVEGKKTLPYNEIFESVGITITPLIIENKFKTGLSYDYNKTTNRYNVYTYGVTEFGKRLGLKETDEVVSINNTILTPQNIDSVLDGLRITAKEGDIYTTKFMRKDSLGNYHENKSSEKIFFIPEKRRNVLTILPESNSKQLTLRRVWLSIKK